MPTNAVAITVSRMIIITLLVEKSLDWACVEGEAVGINDSPVPGAGVADTSAPAVGPDVGSVTGFEVGSVPGSSVGSGTISGSSAGAVVGLPETVAVAVGAEEGDGIGVGSGSNTDESILAKYTSKSPPNPSYVSPAMI